MLRKNRPYTEDRFINFLISVSHIIGIDLGTTNSCFGYFHNSHIQLIEDEDGSYTFPSAVTFTEDGQEFVGNSAKNVAHKYPKTYVYGKYGNKLKLNIMFITFLLLVNI